jgi:hypothetical protein
VTGLPAAPAGTVTPADPRLNDYDLTGQVLGVATGPATGTTGAGPHQTLWAFGLNWVTTPTNRTTGTVGVTAELAATTPTGAVHLPITLPARADRPGGGPSGPMWFLASVPARSTDVAVTVTTGGYPQTFDVTSLGPQPPTPAALYRTPTSWDTVQSVDVTDQIPTPDPGIDFAPDLATATLPVHLHSLTLSWFGPGGPTDTPTDPEQAWLTVDLSSQTENLTLGSDAYLDYNTPITAAGLTLTLPGQAPIAATLTPGEGPDTPGVGIFVDRYAFAVPATLTTAALTVTPGTLQVHGDSDYSPPTTITATGSATFPLTLPPITGSSTRGGGPAGARNIPAPSPPLRPAPLPQPTATE